MSKLERQFHEDRALRDAAKTVLMADLEHARTNFSAKGVAGRVGGRIGEGALDVFEVAKTQADDNRSIIAVLIGAILLWLGRDAILEVLGFAEAPDDAEAQEDPLEPSEKTIESEAPPQTTPSPGEDDEQ